LRQQNGENEAFGKFFMEEKAMQHDSPAQFTPLDRQAFQSFYQENLGEGMGNQHGVVTHRVKSSPRLVYQSHEAQLIAQLQRQRIEGVGIHLFRDRVQHVHLYNPGSDSDWSKR
jgi:hypothetical protein